MEGTMNWRCADDALQACTKFDSIIFDCDGVLIDITGSYDMAIAGTVTHVLENIIGVNDGIQIDQRIIEGFKSTGGYNNEIDLAYAAILSIAASKRLGKEQSAFVSDVIANSDSTGIASTEQYIGGLVDIKDIIKELDYPGVAIQSPLCRIFDQMFYGPQLYKILFKRDSEFSGPGLIENDRVLLSETLLDALQKKFSSNIAMVTGRGIESVRYSLKGLLDRFNLRSSVFLEDEPRELAKPNPKALLDSIHKMNSNCCIYVGDSIEDLIMARSAAESGAGVMFCGITGTSNHPDEKMNLFERNGAQLILKSIDELPKVLNLE